MTFILSFEYNLIIWSNKADFASAKLENMFFFFSDFFNVKYNVWKARKSFEIVQKKLRKTKNENLIKINNAKKKIKMSYTYNWIAGPQSNQYCIKKINLEVKNKIK